MPSTDTSLVFLDEAQAARHPELQALVAVGSRAIEDYVPAFDAFLRSRALTTIITDVLLDLDGHRGRLEASCEERDWRLLQTERFSLAVRKLPSLSLDAADAEPRRSLATVPNDALVGILGSGRVTADLYRSAFERDDEVFDRRHRLERIGRKQLGAGDHLLLHASNEVVDFVEVTGEALTAELALSDTRRIVWNYDVATLQATFASSASVEASRLEFALDLFRIFKERKSLPTLLDIARSHSHHWVRWKAVKTMLHIDLQRGIEALQAALEDPHAHVRNAARSTLRNLQSANLIA